VNWLDPCYVAPQLGPGPGFTDVPECLHHICLRFPDPQTGCLRTGCTAPCATDADCPAEAFCDLSIALAPWLKNRPVCRLGTRDAPPRESCADGGL
jgi:hypothetical protein